MTERTTGSQVDRRSDHRLTRLAAALRERPGAGRDPDALAQVAARLRDEVGEDPDLAVVLGELERAADETIGLLRKIDNLSIALESNREIAVAVGILMAKELLTVDQGFDRLRRVSQRRHQKVREIAAEVVRTGELPRS